MNSIVYSLLISLAVRMTVAAVFVMLIKLLLRNRLSAGMHCAAWGILFIQLIFCIGNVSIPARTSIYNIVPAAGEVIPQTEVVQEAVDIRNIAVWIYVLGAVAMALWFIVIFLCFRKKISHLEVINDPATLDVLNDVKMKLDVRCNITLRYGGLAQMTGRTVILPDGYSCNEQRHILLHELCHYKNKDNLKLWAALCLLCLNWFNPVIWFAFSIYRNDIEMYCDENVMKVTDSKKEYARILIKTAASRSRFVPGTTAVSGGKREVKKRVKNIAEWKKKKRVWAIAAAVLCVSSSCLCLTDAVSVAVENAAVITSTPEPYMLVPTTEPTEIPEIEAATEVVPESSDSIVPVRTMAPRIVQKPVQEEEYSQAEYSTAEVYYGPEEENSLDQTDVTAVEPEVSSGDEQTESELEGDYPELGAPESVSANGNKETYSLDDGRTAVLHYDGDTLETGYIINEDSESDEQPQE